MIKKYWWLAIVLPIAGYFVWQFVTAKNEKDKQLEKARKAKADYALAKQAEAETETEETTPVNQSENDKSN